MSSRKTGDTIKSITSTVIAIAVRVIFFIVLIPLVVKGAKWSYEFGHSIFYASSVDPAPGVDKTITISPGDGAKEVGQLLVDKGLIDNLPSFRVQAIFFDIDMVPGTYTLNTSMTSREILNIINAGPPEDEAS